MRAAALATGVLLAGLGLAGPSLAQSATADAAATDHRFLDIDQALAKLLPIPALRSAPELFGFATVKLGRTLYDNIWRQAAWSALPDRNGELDACVENLKTLPMRARLERANAWINARVTYAPDPALTSHHWGNLAQALAQGRGEREDIAIAKLQLLAAAGVPRRDMYLVLVRDWGRVADDALLAVRDGDQVYVLDSKQDDFLQPSQTGRYFPVLAFSAEGTWIFGRRQADITTTRVSYTDLRSIMGYDAVTAPVAQARPSPPPFGRPGPNGR
ncbi:MAG TPA: transglutaminase-like cysteine peptidase [Caulobacteraceae bacterium]